MSTSNIAGVPQVAHETVSSPGAPVSSGPTRSFSRPTTANDTTHATAHEATNPAPGAPTTAPMTAPNATAEERLSYNGQLNASDRDWKFKFGLQAILVITGIIGIGCFAWIMTSRPLDGSYYSSESYWSVWPSLVTWTVSIIWVFICMLVFLVRKRPVHPGLRVSIDLILWLSFIITAMFTLLALRSTLDWGVYGGPDSWMYDYSYSSNSGGDYVLAANNTWVWEQDNSYITTPRDCTSSSRSLFSEHHFTSCQEQDAYVNKMWAEKPHRANVQLTAVVCQFFGLALHFVLFVWACIDTHHHRRTNVARDAEKLAAGIVQKMIENGTIVPPPPAHAFAHIQGMQFPMQAVYAQQGVGGMQQQLFAGQQPQMGMVPGQYQMPVAMRHPGMNGGGVGAVGPSNEKGAGPRYA